MRHGDTSGPSSRLLQDRALRGFNRLGQTVAEHCEKGMKVVVQGRIPDIAWTDATGSDRDGCEIIVGQVALPNRPNRAEFQAPEFQSPEFQAPEVADRDDQTPF